MSSVAGAAFHLGRATMAKVLDPQHHVLVFSEILRAPLTTTKNHAKALKDRAGSSQQPVMIHVLDTIHEYTVHPWAGFT